MTPPRAAPPGRRRSLEADHRARTAPRRACRAPASRWRQAPGRLRQPGTTTAQSRRTRRRFGASSRSFTARCFNASRFFWIARRSDSRSGESPASTSADRYIDPAAARSPRSAASAPRLFETCAPSAPVACGRRAAESARPQRDSPSSTRTAPSSFRVRARSTAVAAGAASRSSTASCRWRAASSSAPVRCSSVPSRSRAFRLLFDGTPGAAEFATARSAYPRADWRSPVPIRASTCSSSASIRMAGVSSTLSPACTAPDVAWPLERSRKMVVIDSRSTACRSRPRNTCTTDPFSRPSIEPRSTATWPSSTETTTPESRGDRPSALRLRNSVRALPANSSMRAVRMTGRVVTAAESAVTAAPIEVVEPGDNDAVEGGRFSRTNDKPSPAQPPPLPGQGSCPRETARLERPQSCRFGRGPKIRPRDGGGRRADGCRLSASPSWRIAAFATAATRSAFRTAPDRRAMLAPADAARQGTARRPDSDPADCRNSQPWGTITSLSFRNVRRRRPALHALTNPADDDPRPAVHPGRDRVLVHAEPCRDFRVLQSPRTHRQHTTVVLTQCRQTLANDRLQLRINQELQRSGDGSRTSSASPSTVSTSRR